jgi:signal transduction histidine kinase
MAGIEGFIVAPSNRAPNGLAVQEFQTTLVGMIGHDLRQTLQTIQGTYALLRSRPEVLSEQGYALGHRIEVRSIVRQGSLFSIYLPAAPAISQS